MSIDLDKIQQRYREASDHELIRLSKNPADLVQEVLPLLQNELLKRGLDDAAVELSRVPEQPAGINYKELSLEEIRQLVAERLALGEEMDSIKIDLRLQGIDLFEVLKEDTIKREAIFNSIVRLKEHGASEEEIDEHLERTHELDGEQSNEFRSELKSRGKSNKILGVILMVAGATLAVIALSGEYIRGLMHCGIIIMAGVGLFLRGKVQGKE